MKRFSKMLILLTAFIMFAAPVGISLQAPTNTYEISSPISSLSQKTAGLSLELQIADAAFIKLEDCGLTEVWCGVKNAILEIFELVWFQGTQVIASVTAVVVDFLLIHSISSSTYTSGLIEAGWEILRDFVNIVFIFALLIIAFNIVLDRQSSNSKGMLVKTLLVALVLNFSLFITYAVIDASNIFAHLFYDRIETTGKAYVQGQGGGGENGDSAQVLAQFFTGFTGVKSPSTAVLSTFNPQKIIAGATAGGRTPTFFETYLIIGFAGLLNILIAYVFISVALLFLGRTVGLMLLGIFAPLAFGTLTLPNATNIKWIGFTTWWKQLLSLAFTAPIYLLLLYLTVTFATNEGVLASIANVGGGKSVISSILSVILPFALVAILLMTALKVTKTLAGELGGMIVDYAKKGIGGAVAAGSIVATGGMSALGGAARLGGAGLQKVTGGKTGKGLSNFGKGLQATNFNFAQTRVGKMASKASGINMGQNLGNLSYARANTAAYRAGGVIARGVDNTLSGKPSKAVTEWQDNVRAERDKTVLTRIENEQRKAQENAITKSGEIATGYDRTTDTFIYNKEDRKTEDLLKEKRAEKARMSSAEQKQEKDRIKRDKASHEADLEYLNQQIKNTSDPNQRKQLKTQADKIKKTLEDIENTSIEGVITQLEKQLDRVKNDARSDVLKNEGVTDSNGKRILSTKGQTRIETGDTDAARVATGDIKTSPAVGKTPDTK